MKNAAQKSDSDKGVFRCLKVFSRNIYTLHDMQSSSVLDFSSRSALLESANLLILQVEFPDVVIDAPFIVILFLLYFVIITLYIVRQVSNRPERNTMAMIDRLRQTMVDIASFVALIAVFTAKPAYSACGTIDSVYHDNAAVNLFYEDIVFSRGDQLLSCNEKFRLEYLSDNIVLIHTASSQAIWEGPTPTDIDYNFYYYQYPDSTTQYPAKLVVQDDGNLVVSRTDPSGTDTVEFTSNTQGTDCTDTFVPDTLRDDLADNVEPSSSDAASLIRDDACALFAVEVEDNGSTITDISAPVAGPGALQGRTVVHEYKFILNAPESNIGFHQFLIGSARLQKTWYYDGTVVSNAAGGDPDKATLDGDASGPAQVLGYSWAGATPGSEVDAFSPYNGNGKGAHYSSRRALMKWEVPVGGSLIAFKPQWQHELLIKGFADGKVQCEGGTTCKNVPNP